MLTYLLPSVVDISGAGINIQMLSIRKDYEIKIKQSTLISNSVNTDGWSCPLVACL